MSNYDGLGIHQFENGFWGYRFTKTVDGKRINRKGSKDSSGNPLKTAVAAIKAREIAMIRFEASLNQKTIEPMTFQEIYEEYCEKGRSGKAYTTIKKQDSLWKNHISKEFANRFIEGITVAEINDYLERLYYVEKRSYGYVEGFLKMFYLIYGQAYNRNYIDSQTYNRFCVNKETKITMPKRKADEDTDIISFTEEQRKLLDEYFSGTNAETAYMIGKYCGLRVNECYGIKWDNIDLENNIIFIDRQMQYQDGIIKLVPVKTRNARRKIYIAPQLKEYLILLEQETKKAAKELAEQRKQNQTFIKDLDGKEIPSTLLVNCLPNGKIQTENSMKYHAKNIKKRLNLDFKYHYLRHTYGTYLAELNTPTHILCNQMGHASVKVTEKYYLAISKTGIETLINNLSNI